MDGVLNGLEPLQPRVVMQLADAQSKCLKGLGLCALFFARRPARCYSVAMQPLMRRVMGVAWWLSVGLILSACAVLTNPTVTPATSPQSALPTPIAWSTVTLPFSPSPLPSPTTPSAVKPPATQATSPLATPLPVVLTRKVLDLAFVDPQHGWFLEAVCREDHICPLVLLATDDGGQTWQTVNAPPAAAIYYDSNLSNSRHVDALRFATANVGWSFNPDFFSTRDGGQDWDEVVTDQPINLGDAPIGPLCFVDRAHGWLVAAGRVFRTADGGVTWQIFPIQ